MKFFANFNSDKERLLFQGNVKRITFTWKIFIKNVKYFEHPYKTGFKKLCLTNRKVPWNSDQWACLSCPGIVADRIWGRLLVVWWVTLTVWVLLWVNTYEWSNALTVAWLCSLLRFLQKIRLSFYSIWSDHFQICKMKRKKSRSL